MYFLCCSLYFCVVLCIVCFVTYSVLFVCTCVLNYCHRVTTQLQLNIPYYIPYHISYFVYCVSCIVYSISYIIYHIILELHCRESKHLVSVRWTAALDAAGKWHWKCSACPTERFQYSRYFGTWEQTVYICKTLCMYTCINVFTAFGSVYPKHCTAGLHSFLKSS
jgi:hypothetical protein